jgi:hypothetical protein
MINWFSKRTTHMEWIETTWLEPNDRSSMCLPIKTATGCGLDRKLLEHKLVKMLQKNSRGALFLTRV